MKKMTYRRWAYAGATIVFLLSVGITWLLPIQDVFRGIAAMPAVGALIGILYQSMRDLSAHERQSQLQDKKHFFDLAVTSPMASVAFNKHAEFCEKYIKEVHETLVTLISKGPTQQALSNSNRLYQIRLDYSAWITSDISLELEKFEVALRTMAAKYGYADAVRANPNKGESYLSALDESYQLFERILGDIFDKANKLDEDIAIEKVKTKIRAVLGIEELTRIRRWVTVQTASQIEDDS